MCRNCIESHGQLSRRSFIGGGAALAGLAGLGLGPDAARAQVPDAPNAISPDEALERLLAGNGRYAANDAANRDYSVGRTARSQAQHPIAAIVSCADSRVSPELLFDQGPGELFVVRVAGNFVNEDGLASLEYGAKFLGIPLVLILGHSGCGAVDATIKVIQDKAELPGHLPQLVDSLRPGVEAAIAAKPENLLAAATVENVRHNVTKLQAAEPIVSGLVSEGRVKVVGGVYDIATGKVTML
ncbi:carbonic anhydrase [Faunimonas sp. B44]|uniref:carbonic anhydrase n=1 Tax=Faunimonas sp. B44 TaxID=3461493 RepID=UPI004044A29F